MSGKNSVRLMAIVLLLCASLTVVGCSDDAEAHHQLQIYASFYPLYYFAEQIGGRFVEVHTLVPPGVEPHDFEPTPKEMVALTEADMFVYNGLGFETWAEQATDMLNGQKTYVVNASENLEFGDAHDDSISDPHVWLNPLLAKQQAEAIKDALVLVDPDNAETYKAHFHELANQFDALDRKMQEITENAKRKDMIVSHAAFGHLTNAYGLRQWAVSGLSPSAEPTQKELQSLIDYAKENDIKFIMYDTFANSTLTDVVKSEVGAEALSLSSLETVTKAQLEQGEDYFSLMKKNIANLEKALN